MSEPSQDALRQQYEEVCDSYHAINEFRAKLLTLWPILGAAAGGLALREAPEPPNLLALGLLGLATSVGIPIYEWNQSLRCVDLVHAATLLEDKLLGDEHELGSFTM